MLIVITIVWYVYAHSIYSKLLENIDNIHSSKNRLNSLTDIGADIRILNMVQQGRINITRGVYYPDYVTYKRVDLNTSATTLQQAQNNLSVTNLID